MGKNIVPYRQKGDTCAIACMLMILEYYQIIPKANSLLEKKYFKIYKSNYLTGTPLAALAWHFAKNGLKTKIVHSESNYFKNTSKLIAPDLFKAARQEYQEFLTRAKMKGALVLVNVDINANYLQELIENDELIILAGQRNNYLHAILLCGYENAEFIVCDPLSKQKQKMSVAEINDFMDTDLGKWAVIVSN